MPSPASSGCVASASSLWSLRRRLAGIGAGAGSAAGRLYSPARIFIHLLLQMPICVARLRSVTNLSNDVLQKTHSLRSAIA